MPRSLRMLRYSRVVLLLDLMRPSAWATMDMSLVDMLRAAPASPMVRRTVWMLLKSFSRLLSVSGLKP